MNRIRTNLNNIQNTMDSNQISPRSPVSKEHFYVQTQPLIQYGPISIEQLKELYVNEMIDDYSFIACGADKLKSEQNMLQNARQKSSKNGINTDRGNPHSTFRILPNDSSLWTPIRSNLALFSELEDAISAFSKTRKNKASALRNQQLAAHKTNPLTENSNVNFQVNMTVNGISNDANSMDINMNITNSPRHQSFSRREHEALRAECRLLKEQNINLKKMMCDLKKEITTLTAKSVSQCNALKSQMVKELEKVKHSRNAQLDELQSEIARLRGLQRSALAHKLDTKHLIKENEELSAANDVLKIEQNKLIDEKAQMSGQLLYYQVGIRLIQHSRCMLCFYYIAIQIRY